MGFDKLMNKPATERELLGQVVSELQSNYTLYQGLYFFLKLDKVDDRISQISWIKVFTNRYEYRNFFFDTEYERACFLFKYRNERYVIECFGHSLSAELEVVNNEITENYLSESPSQIEQCKQLSWEFHRAAFVELADLVSSSDDGSGAA